MAKVQSELQFTALTRTAELWKNISSAILTIVDEAHFEATREGLQFRSMDPSHVALIDISCPAVSFMEYKCDTPIKFGFRVSDFSKIIKRASPNDIVELSISDSMLSVKTSGSYTKNYKLKLIDSTTTSTPLPKLSFDNKLVMAPSILDRILGDIEAVNAKVTIELTQDKHALFTTTSELGEAKVSIDDKSSIENLNEISVSVPGKVSFSTEFITRFIKAIGMSSELLTAELSTNKPLRLSFTLPNAVKVEFYLAPRVED